MGSRTKQNNGGYRGLRILGMCKTQLYSNILHDPEVRNKSNKDQKIVGSLSHIIILYIGESSIESYYHNSTISIESPREMKTLFLISAALLLLDVESFAPVLTLRRFHTNTLTNKVPINTQHSHVSIQRTILHNHMLTASSVISKSVSFLHQDFMFVLSSLLILSTFGLFLERKTMIGKSLSVCFH